MAEPKLTSKQERFIDEYLIDFNATRAALASGYSEKHAQQIGSQTLIKPQVKAEIERRKEEIALKTMITREMVIQGLIDEAKFLSEGASHGARVAAWAHLGKYLNMFTEKVEIKGTMEVKSISSLIDELSSDTEVDEEDELE